MGSSATPSATSAEFLAVFRAHANVAGAMSFADFMRLALYDARVGYYRQQRTRIGYRSGTDFFTASSSGPVFGELIVAACVNLLRGEGLAQFTFVEIGAEPGGGVLNGVAHPFASVRTVHLGEPIELAGPCVVFSNELLDAQPFRRLVFRGGAWRELGVKLCESGLREVEFTDAVRNVSEHLLPRAAPEGYIIDAPLASVTLCEQIVTQPWHGLFVACDYGKSWQELTEACPAGTARAYRHHVQSNDLLVNAGEQDLTCHVCWDWLEAALVRHGFPDRTLDFQETFWVKHAGDYISKICSEEASRFSKKKQSLLQLLHPAHLGQKFQLLHALRLDQTAP